HEQDCGGDSEEEQTSPAAAVGVDADEDQGEPAMRQRDEVNLPEVDGGFVSAREPRQPEQEPAEGGDEQQVERGRNDPASLRSLARAGAGGVGPRRAGGE